MVAIPTVSHSCMFLFVFLFYEMGDIDRPYLVAYSIDYGGITTQMIVLAKLVVGSRLYGTSIEGSDLDMRGIYLPTLRDCLLGTVKDTITDPTEEDTQYFSIQYFLKLAAQGQSMAIEMLSTPDGSIISSSPMWMALRAERNRFYTRNMHSFLGYAKSMSSKYSSRIDRLKETETIIDAMRKYGQYRMVDCTNGSPRLETIKLNEMWDDLPESVNAVKSINERNSNADKRVYVVCGRELQATVTIEHAHSVVQSIYNSYGERVRKAKDGQLDWKALAHAFRVALQANEIVETGDLIFPLKDADYLRQMRLGQIDFISNRLDQKLDDLINEVQIKMDKSSLPDKVDTTWCSEFILEAYRNVYPTVSQV